ncbi:L,D-transpeptidase family protein [Fulvivirga aurantia]|uniref:L,D-transpeptidase family protein n=1 Tax=Fulvivirga aurantia TaxID=2529383 RepID=UPI001626D419
MRNTPPTTTSLTIDTTFNKFRNQVQAKQRLEYSQNSLSLIPKSKIKFYIAQYVDSVDVKRYISDDVNRTHIAKELKELYRHRDHDLIWVSTKGVLENSTVMLSELLTANRHGFNTANYNATYLLNLSQNAFKKDSDLNLFELIDLDLKMSAAYVTYAWHLSNGMTVPQIIQGRWNRQRHLEPVAKVLAENSVQDAIALLSPKTADYKNLQSALEMYEAIAHKGAWPTLPSSIKLEEGDTSSFVITLRDRLIASGDLKEDKMSNSERSVFDYDLYNAVRRFQYRHGLAVDGVVGKGTIRALNRSVDEKIAMIKLNLERIRWMPSDLGEKYIYVNIPEFKLYIREREELALEMRVIVGSKDNNTPVFDETLEHIVFSPTWKVPKSITQEEILPKIKRDVNYLKRGNYKLYKGWYGGDEPLNPDSIDWSVIDENSLRVVQQPGPGNALGRVKFLMPNNMSIYLHDTPADYLFNKEYRAMSHGCIRLESPDLLAEYLLREQAWDREKINEHMFKEEPVWVGLRTKLPVYIDYRTAWVNKDGLVSFGEDIYGIDQLQASPWIDKNNGAVATIGQAP